MCSKDVRKEISFFWCHSRRHLVTTTTTTRKHDDHHYDDNDDNDDYNYYLKCRTLFEFYFNFLDISNLSLSQ